MLPPQGRIEMHTTFGALDARQNPDQVSNDMRADNVILTAEYGEIAGE